MYYLEELGSPGRARCLYKNIYAHLGIGRRTETAPSLFERIVMKWEALLRVARVKNSSTGTLKCCWLIDSIAFDPWHHRVRRNSEITVTFTG